METKTIKNDWEILVKFLPERWEEKALELGALVRKRKIDSAQTLLRILMLHLAEGQSLRAAANYANEANICNINDTALLNRLRLSGNWLQWMCYQMLNELHNYFPDNKIGEKFRIRLVDGTTICEPGSTGTDWRIHYSFNLNTLKCDSFKITSPKTGEHLNLFAIRQGELILADRGYCKRKGIMHVKNGGGDVIIRFHSTNLPVFTRNNKPFNVLKKLGTLDGDTIADWDVWFKNPEDQSLIKGRLCAIQKSEEAIEISVKKVLRNASKKCRKVREETLEFAKYFIVFTTVTRHKLKADEVLLLYRGRWQVELVFKRLKGIIGIGHLPKTNEESCIAWLHGKMLIALLVERLQIEALFFSPWGYPIK